MEEVLRKLRAEAADGRTLNEQQAKRLLAAAGIPVTREQLAGSAEEAARIAAQIGFPVVLKAQARGLSHKSEAGGVALGLASAEAVRSAFRDIAARVAGRSGVAFEGCLVQEMVSDAEAELIVGTHWDEQFDAMVLVGMGGTWVELLRDTRLAPAPITPEAALALLRSLKLAPLFEGFRGRPRVDLEAAAALVARVSQVAANLGPRLRELDANPVLITGARAVVADARALLNGEAQ
jgi:acetyl-CoA synthetase (ADP-forming)